MFAIEETDWPIVRIKLGDVWTGEMVDQQIAGWKRWLSRNKPFGLMLIQTTDKKAAASKEDEQRFVQWLNDHRPFIMDTCTGVAVVQPHANLLLLSKPFLARKTRKLYGSPAQVFKDIESASAWLTEQVKSYSAV
jgi:hypothetical protein